MLTFRPVTSEQAASLHRVLEKHGFTIEGNRGEIKKMGADVEFCYDPDSQVLSVDIRKAPWVISQVRFTTMIQKEIEAHL